MQRQLIFVCLSLAVAFSAGCAAVSPRSGAGPPVDLRDIGRWHARGRLGVSGPQSGGSGSFEWRQRGDHSEVQIRGPVGVGSVRLHLRGDPSSPELVLQTSDGQKFQAQAAWSELQARLGAPVPAVSLRYWMLGLAAPGEHRWHDENAAGIVTLEQDGWRIDYQRYSSEYGARVPVKMRATNGEARVRIVVDRWQLGQ